jgi:hypothetical protein
METNFLPKEYIIDLRIINGKLIIFPKAIQMPRYKTRGDVENAEGVGWCDPTFA